MLYNILKIQKNLNLQIILHEMSNLELCLKNFHLEQEKSLPVIPLGKMLLLHEKIVKHYIQTQEHYVQTFVSCKKFM